MDNKCHICDVSGGTRVCENCDRHVCESHYTFFSSPNDREYAYHDCNPPRRTNSSTQKECESENDCEEFGPYYVILSGGCMY